jgi:exodeoxyribonuclease-3
VAVYVKPGIKYKVLHATLNKKDFYDEEGRTIVLEFDNFYFINCYWPNGGKSEEHYEYKLEYYKHFLDLAKKLEKKMPIIFCGDVNATNTDLDLARPKENAGKLGCTEPERKALAKFVENFVDTYRHINGDKVQYTWWDMKTRSREKNVGWRIDYFYTSKSLEKKIVNAQIHDDILGSDHCPISLEVKI